MWLNLKRNNVDCDNWSTKNPFHILNWCYYELPEIKDGTNLKNLVLFILIQSIWHALKTTISTVIMTFEVKETLLTEHIVTFSKDYKRLVIATGMMNTQNIWIQNNYSCYFKNFEILLPGRSRKDISLNKHEEEYICELCMWFVYSKTDKSIK